MNRTIAAGFVSLALIWCPQSQAQSGDDVKRLKDQNELLQAKLEAALLKLEKLEKELAAVKASQKATSGAEVSDQEKPVYIMKTRSNGLTGGDTEVKFVVENLTRQGQRFTFDLIATLLKGEVRRPIEFGFYIGIDQDGNRHEGRVNVGRGKGVFGVKINPTADGPLKFSLPITFPDTVKSFKKLQFIRGSFKSPTPVIEFVNLALPQ